jgi:hypothetical protein
LPDLLDHIAAGEPFGCLKPYLLAPLLLGGRVPASLRVPHAPVIRRKPANVTIRALRVHLGVARGRPLAQTISTVRPAGRFKIEASFVPELSNFHN